MSAGRGWGAAALLFGPALCWSLTALAGLAWTVSDAASWAEIDRHGDPVAGSDRCRSCHEDEWASWRRSWHRTMTQRPEPAAEGRLAVHTRPAGGAKLPAGLDQDGVLAPFAGEQLDYLGFRAIMDRGPSGAPRIRVRRLDEDGAVVEGDEPVLAAEVALTVGSHRYQQYVAFLDRGGGPGELWRLPVAWHRGEQRWIHMNGAFVEPEGARGSLPDYERHLSRWNDNCIFCHNTEAVPGLGAGARGDFVSEVGELGIGCEACHGPARAHVDRHRKNPLRRMLAPGRGDGSITHPGELEPARESAVCGRCHGQRIGRDIDAILRRGDGFVPGDVLAEVSRPIFADTTIAGVDGLDHGQPFAARFWPDGTPRLSAYEYQGLLLSPCDSGEGAGGDGLGCNHCHDMHGDDPDGQLRAGRAGEGACVDCHRASELGGGSRIGGHGGHGELAPQVDCLDCHMPAITYGLLEGMRSHRITSPDPGALVGRDDQPDACTQCHVDRSRSWAAGAMDDLGLDGSTPDSPEPLRERAASRVVLDLLGGDPIQRNLAAHALAAPGATGSVEQRMAWLADGLEDEYPSVRWFAWRGLRSLASSLPEEHPDRAELLAALADFDYLGPVDERVAALSRVRARLGAPALADDAELREVLIEGRLSLAIWIGE